MAQFSEVEKELLKDVDDEGLKTSLRLIREANESIWSSEAPRVIQDYTDHGVKHCERLASHAHHLLQANNQRKLSTHEMYLLLAGIYIHDIGMQCDVVLFPEIRTAAESLGAIFEQEFRSIEGANHYSSEEQAEIRKNHHYLSIGWLEYAKFTGKTCLGPAAQSVPDDLVQDLMDICVHHTKLPITDCPVSYQFYSNERKQLVAALLRFADELDIDKNRVRIDTVKTFSLAPLNKIYWWLHNHTVIDYIAQNVIKMTVTLHPNDFALYGPLIQEKMVTEFHTKNRSVMTVLAQNGLAFIISADSRVVADRFAKVFPPELLAAFQTLHERKNPVLELADEVRTWLRAIQYEVSEPLLREGRFVEMMASLNQGTVKQQVLIRCIMEEVTARDVEKLDGVLDRKTPQGWLISDVLVAQGAREQSVNHEGVKVFNLSGFLKEMVWSPYINALTHLVEVDRIHDLYVDIGCYKRELDEQGQERRRDRYSSLDAYIGDWLKDRGKSHISILSDFGSGKTWFCRHYAYRQLQRYLDDPVTQRFPLLLTLRHFANATTTEQLVNEALLQQYKMPFVGSAYEIIQEMNRRGKLLLILDGFDELALRVDYKTVVDKFWELAKLVQDNSKVILTSRTVFFRDASEAEKLFKGEERGLLMDAFKTPKFEVVYLEPLTNDQIQLVIRKRLEGEKGENVAEHILTKPDLAMLARKPILTDLLLTALEEEYADVLDNQTRVYLYATSRLMQRDILIECTIITMADKLFFLTELAWEMIDKQEMRVHFTAIPKKIIEYFKDKILDEHQQDSWERNLLARTLLHRDAAGYYEFAHKSLAEYFVALKMVAELGCLNPMFMKVYHEVDGRPCIMPFEDDTTSGRREQSDRKAELLPHTSSLFLELLPRNVMVFAADMVLGYPPALDKLCELARSATGSTAWYACTLLPFIKSSSTTALTNKLVGKSVRHPLSSGVTWVLGELGHRGEQRAIDALENTVKAFAEGKPESSITAWWEAAFALEKLGRFEFGQDSMKGDGPIQYLTLYLPVAYSFERALENIENVFTDSARNFGPEDIVAIMQHKSQAIPIIEKINPPIEFFCDTSLHFTDARRRSCYFVIWLLGHLGIKKNVDMIVEAAKCTTGSMRNCACEALGKLGVVNANVIDALMSGLRDNYHRTRFHAAWSLSKLVSQMTKAERNAVSDNLSIAIDLEDVNDVRSEMVRVQHIITGLTNEP